MELQQEHPSWVKEYCHPNIIVEIVDFNPDRDRRWKFRKHYSQNNPIAQKLRRIDELDAAGVAVFLWKAGSIGHIPTDKRPRILGGGVAESCVKARKKILEKAGIEAIIDPRITIFKKDLEKK